MPLEDRGRVLAALVRGTACGAELRLVRNAALTSVRASVRPALLGPQSSYHALGIWGSWVPMHRLGLGASAVIEGARLAWKKRGAHWAGTLTQPPQVKTHGPLRAPAISLAKWGVQWPPPRGYDGVTTGSRRGYNGYVTGLRRGYDGVTTGLRMVTTGYYGVTTGLRRVTTGYDGVTRVTTGLRRGYDGLRRGYDGVTTGYDGLRRGYDGVTTGLRHPK